MSKLNGVQNRQVKAGVVLLCCSDGAFSDPILSKFDLIRRLSRGETLVLATCVILFSGKWSQTMCVILS